MFLKQVRTVLFITRTCRVLHTVAINYLVYVWNFEVTVTNSRSNISTLFVCFEGFLTKRKKKQKKKKKSEDTKR